MQTDDNTVRIEPNSTAYYRLDAVFDTENFPMGDPANLDNLQDGCVGQWLTLDFGPLTYDVL